MKKILVAIALAAFASTAFAQVAGGAHDMTTVAGGTTKGVCQYCHAPHLWTGSNIPVGNGDAPLWNRNDTGAYTSYGTTTAGTVVGAPGARSRTCLSCHDGVTNVGVVNNGPDETLTAAAMPVVGTILTNDHPVSVTIPAGTDYQAPVNFPLDSAGQVQCASCHEPHAAVAQFLRTPVGDFCGECHTK